MEKMNLEDNQFNESFKKEFKFQNETVTFKKLYEFLEKNDSPFTSLYYSTLYSNINIHVLIDKQNIDNIFFFAKKIYTLIIKDSEEKSESFKIISSYEIKEIINKKDKQNIYIGNMSYYDNCNFFLFSDKSENIILFHDKETINQLPMFSSNIFIAKNNVIEPIFLTKYYSLYFYDDPNKLIDFDLTKERRELMELFNNYFSKNNKIFKFTGPSGIGKSFFLLYYSRLSFNIVYLNIAAIRYLVKKRLFNKMKNVFIEEFQRVQFETKEVEAFNEIIKNMSPFDIENNLISIINFCKGTNKNIKIILDQFKEEFNANEIELGNIKIIMCSSVNDKSIRTSCLNNFKNIIFKKLNINPMHYLYIQRLYEDKDKKNKLLSYLGNVPKYTVRIKNCQTYEEYLLKIDSLKNTIIDKLKKFYRNDEFYENIINAKQNLDMFIEINNFENIIKYYPLKYFIISFYESCDEQKLLFGTDISKANYFKMTYLFPFLSEIFGELMTEPQKNFFIKGLFTSHTGSTVGGFFELVAINAIKNKKITLPNGPIQNSLQVSKICNMDEIKPTLYQKIEGMFNKKKEIMEIEKKEESKKNNIENEAKGIFGMLTDEDKQNFIKDFIYNENIFLSLTNDYINNFSNFALYVDDKLKYSKIDKILIDKNIKKVNIINHDYSINDQNILITQEKENAEIYDLAYLYGPSNNKTFVGFQMKSYKDIERIGYRNYKLNKEKVIEKSKQLILNSKYLLDVEITEWHYFVVGIFFDDISMKNYSLKTSYSEDLILYCKDNKLELILYNPINDKFYDSKKNILTELSMTDLSKIEGKKLSVFKFEEKNEFLGKKRAFERCFELEILLKDITCEQINKDSIYLKMTSFMNKIKSMFKLKKLNFIGKKSYNSEFNFIPIPNDNTILIFKEKKTDKEKGLNKYCIYIKFPQEKSYVYRMKNNKIIKYNYDIEYFHLFDLNKSYYVFSFE